MPDDTQGVMPEKPETAPAQQQATVTVEQLQAELDRARDALKTANREAAERRKKLDAIEAEETKRKEAEMTEAQKLAKQLEAATAELQTLKTTDIKRRLAAKYSLPEALALRIQGKDEAEMDTDAKALAEALPKAPKPQPGPVTNPGANGKTGETLSQQLARIHGQNADPWNLDTLKNIGGGVFFTGGKDE